MIAFPPFEDGAVQVARSFPSPVTPFGSVPEVVADVGAPGTVPIVIENDDVSAVCEKLSVTRTTTVAEPELVGVPEITPVEVFSDNPSADNSVEPDVSAYVLVAPPPEAITESEYAKPRVPVKPDEGVVIETTDRGIAVVVEVAVPEPTEFRALI